MDYRNDYRNSSRFNFAGVKNTASGVDVRSDEQLRKFLVEVGINEGAVYEIDQFFHNDIPSSNLSPQVMEWVMGYYDVISGYLLASTTNKKSGRRYDWTPLILKAYERAKSIVVISKAHDGWATHNVLKREMIQRYHEQSNQNLTQENKKKGWFDKPQEQQNVGYGSFER